jgi:hypothetical protein
MLAMTSQSQRSNIFRLWFCYNVILFAAHENEHLILRYCVVLEHHCGFSNSFKYGIVDPGNGSVKFLFTSPVTSRSILSLARLELKLGSLESSVLPADLLDCVASVHKGCASLVGDLVKEDAKARLLLSDRIHHVDYKGLCIRDVQGLNACC